MIRTALTQREQIGLHVLLTAHSIGLIEGNSSIAIFQNNISVTANWFRDRAYSIDILMHDDPVYNAARVKGRFPKEYDKLDRNIWMYAHQYADKTIASLSRPESEPLKDYVRYLADFVLLDNREIEFDLHQGDSIVDPGADREI